MFLKEVRFLESLGLCQRWQLSMKQDGMHPDQKPLELILHLRMWPDGGVTGVVERDFIETHRDDIFGDIFGSWTMKSICFYILNRSKTRSSKMKVEGNWTETGIYTDVSEGRMTNTERLQTLGTFKMHIIRPSWEGGKPNDPENAIEKENGDSFMNGLRDYILTQPEEQHFYDFKIICNDNNEVKSHKIILASQTKYFEGLFRQQKSDQIQLDFHSDAVRPCIRYLYTEDISITGENVQDILVVANYLIIPKIVRICVRYILTNMDVTNSIDILNLGDQFNIPEITRAAKDAISFSLSCVFEDESRLKNTPLHLLKTLLSNENVTLKNSRKVTLKDTQKQLHLEAIATSYCTMTDQMGELEGLLDLIKSLPVTRSKTFESQTSGSFDDRPELIHDFDVRKMDENSLHTVTLKSSIWDGRTVISGMVLKWTDGTTYQCGGGEVTAEYEVPEGEHVSFVYGFAGWYVDNLTFVLSNGKLLGPPLGGDGGGYRNSLETLPRSVNIMNCCLTGMKGKVVRSQGVNLITGLQFLYEGDISKEEELAGATQELPHGLPAWAASWQASQDEMYPDPDVHL